MESRFIAVDGESFTTEDGEHRYVLLMAGTNDYIFREEGLGTTECFRFLLRLHYDNPKKLFVAFGLNYDVNMMLRDLGRDKLKELWTETRVFWRDYLIEWIPGKWLRIAYGDFSIKVYETFGFFQTSFVKTLALWEFEPGDFEGIEAMKEQRGVFDDQLTEKVIEYCLHECVLLQDLMYRLAVALNGVSLTLNSWAGAGSIASSLLTREGVRRYSGMELSYPQPVKESLLYAYFGGRTELFKQGIFQSITEYDVRSAYPAEAVELPTLEGSWYHTTDYDPDQKYAIWHCSWDGLTGVLMPFPVRLKNRITYPTSGEGWYHNIEVREALRTHPNITVCEGWVFTPDDASVRPFDFVKDIYTERARLKQEGHAGEKCLKLGINAIYGKLAQGIGFRGKPPTFRSYFWAGRITAGTRARMQALARDHTDKLVMIATDGIFYNADPSFKETNALGGLEKVVLTNCFTAQPGVYHAYMEDGTELRRSRGFFAREIDFESLREGFLEHYCDYTGRYSSKRFIGLGSALMRKDMSLWRTWYESTRSLSLTPSTKFAADQPSVYDGSVYVAHHPPSYTSLPVSEPYVPKSGGYLDNELDYIEGQDQPLKVL